MSNTESQRPQSEEIEAVLLDADLFIKYKSPQRAITKLQSAIERFPRSISLREKLKEVAANHKMPEEAARQCLALANLYIKREDFEAAYDRLLEAKQLDPRISIASGVEAIRRARRPDLMVQAVQSFGLPESITRRNPILAGDLSAVSIFDAVQVLENAKLTGTLSVNGGNGRQGQIFFNDGRIVGAESGAAKALDAFRIIVEITTGNFDFEKSPHEFPITINAASNTNLILDTLRQLDEENM